jgi:hypothetical protein
MTYTSTALGSMSLLLIVWATPVPKKKAAKKLKNAAQKDRLQWRQNVRGDDSGYRVGSVMEAVEEIENESNGDEGKDKVEDRHRSPSTVLEQNARQGFGGFFATLDRFFQQIMHDGYPLDSPIYNR